MNIRKRGCFSHLHLTFSLLLVIAALIALVPAQQARACDDGDGRGQIGFVIQAPLDSTFSAVASCPTISVLGGVLIDTTNAVFGDGGYDSGLYCATLNPGQVVRVTFATDTPSSGTPSKLIATSVTSPGNWGDNSGNVIIGGAIRSITSSGSPAAASAVTILGLTINLATSTILSVNDDEPLTLQSLAALTANQLIEGQFAIVSATATSGTPDTLAATSLYLRLLETKIIAPLDSGYTCPNISVLGQTIATTSTTTGPGGSPLNCSDLTPGQWVKVVLMDQTLTATEVEPARHGWFWGQSQPRIIAPIVNISDTALPYTLTVLGSGTINVDISEAPLVNELGQPIAVGQLMQNQFVDMMLSTNVPAASSPQFTATGVESLTPANVVNFWVFDPHGNRIIDGKNDVRSAVTFVGKGGKTVTLQATSNGSFSVANLPAGQANVSVKRVNGGQTSQGTGTVKVTPTTTNHVNISLKSGK
jgi:hypothetical protein